MWYPIKGAPPSGAWVHPKEIEDPVVAVMARVGGAGGTRARTIDEVISSLETGQQTIDTPARRSGRSVVGQDRNMVNLMRSVTQSIAPPESYNPNRRVRGSRGAAGREETPAAVSANQMSYNQKIKVLEYSG